MTDRVGPSLERIADADTTGRARGGGQCLLAADGATGLNRGSGSRVRYIGARAPVDSVGYAPAGRRAPSLFMGENRKTINSNLPAESKKKHDKFLFAHRGPPVSVSLPAVVVSARQTSS